MEKLCVILFVDLAGSVNLYGRFGDETAKRHVLDLQHRLMAEIERFKGKVEDVIGDELMVRFAEPDTALACTLALHGCAEKYSQQQDVTLQLRVGLHYGAVIIDQHENRLFGDTINVASRVTNIAQAGQTITTDALVQCASATWQNSVRRFDIASLKGKRDSVVIYDLPWKVDDLTAIASIDEANSPQNISELLLSVSHGDKAFELSKHDGVFSIGRAITNDLVVAADSVSRRHILIERIRNNLVLTDQSTNGTHLYMDNGETLFLRRQQWPMSGAGVVALGATRDQRDDHLVRFNCRQDD